MARRGASGASEAATWVQYGSVAVARLPHWHEGVCWRSWARRDEQAQGGPRGHDVVLERGGGCIALIARQRMPTRWCGEVASLARLGVKWGRCEEDDRRGAVTTSRGGPSLWELPSGADTTPVLTAQGPTELTRVEVRALMAELAADFPGDMYNLVTRNYNHFCDAACRCLVCRASRAGSTTSPRSTSSSLASSQATASPCATRGRRLPAGRPASGAAPHAKRPRLPRRRGRGPSSTSSPLVAPRT